MPFTLIFNSVCNSLLGRTPTPAQIARARRHRDAFNSAAHYNHLYFSGSSHPFNTHALPSGNTMHESIKQIDVKCSLTNADIDDIIKRARNKGWSTIYVWNEDKSYNPAAAARFRRRISALGLEHEMSAARRPTPTQSWWQKILSEPAGPVPVPV